MFHLINRPICKHTCYANIHLIKSALKGTHRTRSRAAPDWTAEESLVLVNEINAIESDWGATLPSFQKWKQIVENCNALGVSRNLNQCKRKWDALLSEYRWVRHQPDGSLPIELFEAIHSCVNAKGRTISGGDVDTPEQLVMETDPDSDPEAQGRVTELLLQTGSKKQRPRMKRKKRRLETLSPWGYFTSPKTNHEESSSINERVVNTVETLPEEAKKQIMAIMLYENAVRINSILGSNPADVDDDDDDDLDYKLMDLKNAEALQTDFTRHQGDELIDCLGKISVTLNQLCELVQQCK